MYTPHPLWNGMAVHSFTFSVCQSVFVCVCVRESVSPWSVGTGRRGSNSPPDSPRGHQQPGGPLGNEAPHYDPSQGVPIGPGTEQDAEAAYHRMELLSQSIRNELQRDLHIHDSAVLPNFINLPQVCLHSLLLLQFPLLSRSNTSKYMQYSKHERGVLNMRNDC